MLKHPISSWLIIAAICCLAILPFFWWGSPSGHDFEFHMYSWMDVLNQWKQGVVYPRWAALAHWGYGEPRFVFYPPASWTLGAALGAILPWRAVPGTYCWLVLTIAGMSMYAVARRWLRPFDALFAAAFYAVNPYHLLIVYWRSAYAELLAAALVPLVLLAVIYTSEAHSESLRTVEAGLRPTLWLSLLLAGAWLTNIPAAVMIHYSAAGLAILLALGRRSLRPIFYTGFAILWAAGLASFYLIPAIYEQPWVNISQVLSPGVRPQDNFLFTSIADPDHNRFNLLVSFVALSEIGVLALAIAFSFRRKAYKVLLVLLTAWGAGTAFVMVRASNLLWVHLPELRYAQLPFRWLLCLNAALALLLAIATASEKMSRWVLRGFVFTLLVLTLVLAGQRTQPPWWDTASDIREMTDAISDGTGYEGTDEYVPAGADPSDLNKDLPLVSDEKGAAIEVRMIHWEPTEKQFLVHSKAPRNLTLRLFNYPAWSATVNGQAVAAKTAEVTKLMVIPVGLGDSHVNVRFRRTPDRWIGDVVSLITMGLFGMVCFKTRSKSASAAADIPRTILIATSNPGKLRDFAGAAETCGISIRGIPDFSSLPPVVEDGLTFEANARKKAEEYSRAVPGELVIADDSGLEIDALNGAPGVYSARYAVLTPDDKEPGPAAANTNDEANNNRVLSELSGVPPAQRTARFVCVIAAARDGQTMQTFRGTAEGVILSAPRGENGFGYDPLFYFPQIDKTFAELSSVEKAKYSHRGAALRQLVQWITSAPL